MTFLPKAVARWGFLASLVAVPARAETSLATFDASREFPNYFVSEKFSSLSKAEQAKEVAAMRKLTEDAMGSVLNRVIVPVVKPGDEQATLVRYFDYMGTHLKPIDPHAKVEPSGGVVRSAWSYIIDEIREGVQLHPSRSPRETLLKLASDTHDIPATHIRGVGSDWDLLLTASSPETFQKLQSKALEITNSAEAHYGFVDEKSARKRALFAVGDVKDRNEQLQRSTRQGGSLVDFLSFDLERKKFREPEAFPGIVDDLIRGEYRYVAPASPQAVEDAAKQTIRGIRPLLELPYLKLKDETQFREELETLLHDPQGLTNKALDQFAKMVRNARYSGANNRFYRAAPGSVDELVKDLADKFNGQPGAPLIPEFVDRFPLRDRKPKALPKALLMDPKVFFAKHTDAGVVYHGTKSMENGLSILRKGLFVSSDEQGVAAFGRGAYSSPDIDFAKGYAGPDGLVFRLKVKNDPNVRILNWPEVESSAPMQKIIEEANRTRRDVFEVLARDYGVDIIVNHHVLLQNLDALEFPKNMLGSLALTYADVVTNPEASFAAKRAALHEYGRLYDYVTAVEGHNEKLLSPPHVTAKVIGDLQKQFDATQDPYLRVTRGAQMLELGGAPDRITSETTQALKKIQAELFGGAGVNLDEAKLQSLREPLEALGSLAKTSLKTASALFSDAKDPRSEILQLYLLTNVSNRRQNEFRRNAESFLRSLSDPDVERSYGFLTDEETRILQAAQLSLAERGATSPHFFQNIWKLANDPAYENRAVAAMTKFDFTDYYVLQEVFPLTEMGWTEGETPADRALKRALLTHFKRQPEDLATLADTLGTWASSNSSGSHVLEILEEFDELPPSVIQKLASLKYSKYIGLYAEFALKDYKKRREAIAQKRTAANPCVDLLGKTLRSGKRGRR